MSPISILDGYIDEPTCLGVPPYISPYPRYIAGAIHAYDHTIKIQYMTIDQLRTQPTLLDTLASSTLVVIVAGMSVPGKYLSGSPLSPNELTTYLHALSQPKKILCGPAARYGFGMSGGKRVRDLNSLKQSFDLVIKGDAEIVLTDVLQQNLKTEDVDPLQCRTSPEQIRTFAIRGASLVTQHPFYPKYLIAEIETYRGCSRSITGGCSFCSEPHKGAPSFRSEHDIIEEVSALYAAGIRHFRLGNQPCIFSYKAHDANSEEYPKPNPEALTRLFRGIRTIAPALKTLHIDNANPGVLARYPDECRRIAKTIITYHTSGDVAAFGVESVDPAVISQNNLKASAEQVYDAVTLLNDVGSARGSTGLPELLPGLNFVFGLKGETKETYRLNYEFIQRLFDAGLLLRRINLRQAIPLPETPLSEIGTKIMKKHKQDFHRLKIKIREHIDKPLLQRLVPTGTVLTDVYTELSEGSITFGRQLGSYPILIGISGTVPLHRFYNVKIVDYGSRSLTAVPFPLNINLASRATLEALPGIGKKRVNRILLQRPFHNADQFLRCLDDPDLARQLLQYVTFYEQ